MPDWSRGYENRRANAAMAESREPVRKRCAGSCCRSRKLRCGTRRPRAVITNDCGHGNVRRWRRSLWRASCSVACGRCCTTAFATTTRYSPRTQTRCKRRRPKGALEIVSDFHFRTARRPGYLRRLQGNLGQLAHPVSHEDLLRWGDRVSHYLVCFEHE